MNRVAFDNVRAKTNHSVVVYGVTYDASEPAGTAMYTVHMGQSPGNTVGACEEFNALFFYEYGYILV